MTSPFVRRSTTITAAAVFAGLVAAPVAASAASAPAGILPGIPDASVIVADDPDGAGDLYTLTDDVSTFTTITMPNNATLDGGGNTITAVEDADHPTFPGAVVESAAGTFSAAHLRRQEPGHHGVRASVVARTRTAEGRCPGSTCSAPAAA